MTQIILFNKPYGVLSQFSSADGHPGLASFINRKGFYPAGRLDRDSEGLLLLTDDGQLQARISQPKFKLPKVYLVQVEGKVCQDDIKPLREGLILNDGPALPAKAEIISHPDLWERNPPIRHRQRISTSWLKITITEGRNRQVRRMTAAIGFPTLRLIRVKIGNWQLGNMLPGEFRLESVHLPSKQKKNTHNKATRHRSSQRVR